MKKEMYRRVLAAALLLLLAVLSCLWIADWASSVNTHKKTITSLDEKANTILKLSGAAVTASAVISAFPDDTATPLSEKLADFTEYFLLILCVIYAEKYGVTILCALAFRLLIPLACVSGIVHLFRPNPRLKRLALRLVGFALAISIIIPVGTFIADKIYDTYETSIENTVAAAEQFTLQDDAETDGSSENGVIHSFLNGVSATVSNLLNRATDTVRRFVETLAILIVTSCVIPVLVFIFFIWLAKNITGIDASFDITPWLPRKKRHHGDEKPALEAPNKVE